MQQLEHKVGTYLATSTMALVTGVALPELLEHASEAKMLMVYAVAPAVAGLVTGTLCPTFKPNYMVGLVPLDRRVRISMYERLEQFSVHAIAGMSCSALAEGMGYLLNKVF
ncbi:hypothetical protein H6504_00025 [Candidatus Woesearchaeota archaeon]|nr:hypothetical protein [Candidatus Woesearchaeota archaeon]